MFFIVMKREKRILYCSIVANNTQRRQLKKRRKGKIIDAIKVLMSARFLTFFMKKKFPFDCHKHSHDNNTISINSLHVILHWDSQIPLNLLIFIPSFNCSPSSNSHAKHNYGIAKKKCNMKTERKHAIKLIYLNTSLP